MNPTKEKTIGLEREKGLAAKICTLDFCYENSLVKIVANRNCPEIKLAGLTVGPFDEGNEYEVYFWVAKELATAGMVHFREDDILDATKLFKVQWKEGVQIPGQISELSDDFYPKLRRFIVRPKRSSLKAIGKIPRIRQGKTISARHREFSAKKNSCSVLCSKPKVTRF